MQHQLSRRLAERLLGIVVSQDAAAPPLAIREWVDQETDKISGKDQPGFDQLAAELSQLLHERISRETVRRWYYNPDPERKPRRVR